MCGLVGIYNLSSSTEEGFSDLMRLLVITMTDTLAHRGPDASGFLSSDRVAFGHRRLSILDTSDAGAQPMRLGEKGPMITYNGEVYNFRDLRSELQSLGCSFRGNSDTEVVLQSYAHWGLAGLKRLEGIFAFALWDPGLNRLVLMRDRLGVKPLFYGESRHGLAFGSEIKSVLAAGGVDTLLDDQSLSEYLWYGNPYGDRTFYRGVRAIEPGHWLIVEGGNRRIEPWWSIEEYLERFPVPSTFLEAADQVRDSLDYSVARQLVADVPVGIFLSGGVDSSSIAAAAVQHLSDPLNSYAAGFDFDRGINELSKAARVAQHLGLAHHKLEVSGSDLETTLITLAQAHDEPFGDAANIPLYLMCKQLSGNLKVVLQGDGGDELFGGYRRYTMLRNSNLWRVWPPALSQLIRSSGNLGRRFARMADSVGQLNPALRMAFLLTTETLQNSPEALFLPERQHELAESTDPFLAYRMAAKRFHAYEPVQQMLLTDLTVQLPSQFLTKVDRASMAAGIEARVPFLDENLVKLAVNLPSTWKVKGNQDKAILRQSQRGRLPKDILHGPKTGFGVPYSHWLRTSLYEFACDRILDKSFLEHYALDNSVMEKLMLQHRDCSSQRGFMLWKILQLSLHYDLNSNHYAA